MAVSEKEIPVRFSTGEKLADSIFMLHFDIVHGCQLRCVGCPNSTLQPKVKRIDPDFFDRCLRNIDVDYVHTLRLFNFGEPLLHRRLPEILDKIPGQRWKPAFVEISTNAQFTDWDSFEEAMKLQVLNRLVVSCDGDGTPASYEALRPPSKWEKLIEFLERVRGIRDRWAPGMQLITRTIIDDKAHMAPWREVLEPRGWKPEFRGWKVLPESQKMMINRRREEGHGACLFIAKPDQFHMDWHGDINLLYVDWDGTVVPCCMHPRASVFGNLKDMTYNEILAGERRRRFKAMMESDRAAMPICNECEIGPPDAPGSSFFDQVP